MSESTPEIHTIRSQDPIASHRSQNYNLSGTRKRIIQNVRTNLPESTVFKVNPNVFQSNKPRYFPKIESIQSKSQSIGSARETIDENVLQSGSAFETYELKPEQKRKDNIKDASASPASIAPAGVYLSQFNTVADKKS